MHVPAQPYTPPVEQCTIASQAFEEPDLTDSDARKLRHFQEIKFNMAEKDTSLEF